MGCQETPGNKLSAKEKHGSAGYQQGLIALEDSSLPSAVVGGVGERGDGLVDELHEKPDTLVCSSSLWMLLEPARWMPTRQPRPHVDGFHRQPRQNVFSECFGFQNRE